MAHKTGASNTRNLRDSKSKRLGLKFFNLEKVTKGSIIIRQRGTLFNPGLNAALGKDDTIYALKSGLVIFKSDNSIHILE